MGLGTKNIASLKKAKDEVTKLTSPPVDASDKTNLLKFITDGISSIEKTLPPAKQLKKDENHLRDLKKQKDGEKQIKLYADTKMKYRDALLKSVYKISDDFSKAADLAVKMQKALEKLNETKLAKELDDLSRTLWGISTEHATYTIWKDDVVD
jgi:DNA repair ATPase RecN